MKLEVAQLSAALRIPPQPISSAMKQDILHPILLAMDLGKENPVAEALKPKRNFFSGGELIVIDLLIIRSVTNASLVQSCHQISGKDILAPSLFYLFWTSAGRVTLKNRHDHFEYFASELMECPLHFSH
jgi:hypothetical protein